MDHRMSCEEVLALPISALRLSTRAKNVLTHWSGRGVNGCEGDPLYKTIGDVAAATDADLLRMTNFSKVSIAEVRREISYMLQEHPQPTTDANFIAWCRRNRFLLESLRRLKP